MSDVWADDYFKQGDKVKLLVALAIADSARSEDGKAWPSIETIASKSRTSTRGAQEAIREMEKDSKIKVEVGAGPMRTNVYKLYFTPHAVHPRTRCTLQTGGGKSGAGLHPIRKDPLGSEESSAPPLAEIPTAQEVRARGSTSGIPPNFCDHFFNYHTENNSWLNQWNRLINWPKKLSRWWFDDKEKIMAQLNGSKGKVGTEKPGRL